MGLGALVEVLGYSDSVTVSYSDGRRESLPPGLGTLGTLLDRLTPEGLQSKERFIGGAVGYITYDAVRQFEKLPDRHPLPPDVGLVQRNQTPLRPIDQLGLVYSAWVTSSARTLKNSA